ncbi:hypothetical protein HD554DRAFT_2029140 [Boletus coccyginus]|nr:hypothetical protein HD554DRAFT_2029144 [Boletus coccyginus]KAI9459752.1 hypothetical protein HD554DRAFT_2029140 [Boletus coccyginus]
MTPPDLPRERHSTFYYADGTVIFLSTRETLYKLYPGHLARQSPVFGAMLSLPQGENEQAAEGRSDDNPIVLHGVVRKDFDHLLCYLFGRYGGSNSELQRQEFLISVLKLSDFYQIDLGFQYAVAELKRLPSATFEPSLKLQLGRQFRIHEWVEPSFCAMLERPVSSISRLEAHRMGMEYFWILTMTKAKIDDHYRALAYTEPPLDQLDDLCETPEACAAVWKDEWWNGIARHLLHPESPCRSQSGIISLLQETDFDGGICVRCKAGIMLKLMDSSALLYKEELEDIAAVMVMDAQMNDV